jgi:hypothetical protein
VAAALSDLQKMMKTAKTDDEWQQLAAAITPTAVKIMQGAVKASSSQASLIRHIFDRAYGRVSKTQEDKAGASGLVVLPTLGSGQGVEVCKRCQEIHMAAHLDTIA